MARKVAWAITISAIGVGYIGFTCNFWDFCWYIFVAILTTIGVLVVGGIGVLNSLEIMI